MENHDGEARHHGLTGDPGDEQPDLSNIIETPEWLKDNPHPDLPETCYTKEECLKRIREGGPISCRRQPACSS